MKPRQVLLRITSVIAIMGIAIALLLPGFLNKTANEKWASMGPILLGGLFGALAPPWQGGLRAAAPGMAVGSATVAAIIAVLMLWP